MTNKKKYYFQNNVPITTKCTEIIGNIQFKEYDNCDNFIELRKVISDMFESFKFIDSYYFIVHNDSEHVHVHYILLLNCQVRLSTLLNKFSDYLNINTLAISIDKLISIVGALKYFLHIDSDSIKDNKKQYEDYEIISNDSDMIIKGYLDSDNDDNVSIRLIKQLVIECDIKSDVLIKLGSDKLLRKNRYKIDTLWNDKATLMLRQEDNLPF